MSPILPKNLFFFLAAIGRDSLSCLTLCTSSLGNFMTKYFSLWAFILLLFVQTSLFAQGQRQATFVVEKIDISAANPPSGSAFNPQQVRSRMKTHEGELFSQTEFDSDLKSLAQEYDRLEPSIEVVEGRVFIKLKIWLKPHIRSVQWNGNDHFKANELQKELGIPVGSVFDRLAFNKAFHKLKAFYVKKGYFEAELDYSVEIDPVSNEVDVTVTICEGRCGKIEDIIFCGFTSDEEEEILEKMVTKTWSFFMSWITSDGIYNEDAIQQDQYVISNYLQNKGFADAKVTIHVEESKCEERILVHITADKGPLYTIGKITVEGNTLFTEEEIFTRLAICEGRPYSPERIHETVQNISNLYGTFGYIDALVDYEPTLDNEAPVYNLHFTIDEGDQYRVGMIKVFGNVSTQACVILHESLLIPGEVFNITKLQKTEERLRNIGYFKCVNVYAVRSEEASCLGENYRDVHIEVEETNTGNFSAFFGFSNIEAIFGGFHITEKNFNYKGLSRVWSEGYRALRGGGEYAHFTCTIGSRSRSYVLSWTKPYFRDTPWVVGFDLEQSNNRYISRNYNINAVGGTVHAKYPLNPYLRFGCHYRLRNSTVHIVGDEREYYAASDKAFTPAGTAACKLAFPQLYEEGKNDGLISAAGISLVYDSTDSPAKPTCGFRSRFEVEFAGLGGEHKFLGLGYLNTWYVPVTQKSIFKVRADAKYLMPCFGTDFAHIPLDERLFLGGDNTVRGYRSYAIGPKFYVGCAKTDDPRGGMSLNLFTMEYVYRYSKRWEGFVFFDAGMLSDDEWSFGNLSNSVGFGLRVVVFESGPPLTVGMGFPINPASHGDVKRFFFSIGGNF